jgi:hypothetical protein
MNHTQQENWQQYEVVFEKHQRSGSAISYHRNSSTGTVTEGSPKAFTPAVLYHTLILLQHLLRMFRLLLCIQSLPEEISGPCMPSFFYEVKRGYFGSWLWRFKFNIGQPHWFGPLARAAHGSRSTCQVECSCSDPGNRRHLLC